MGELESLKDRLTAIRKEAKQVIRSLQQHEGIVTTLRISLRGSARRY